MDFAFNEKAEKIRKEIRQFVKNELPPNHIGISFSEEMDDGHWELSMQTSKKLAQRGWLTISWPKEFGGMGATFWEQVVFKEEAGYWGIPGDGMGIGGTNWVGPTVMLMGTDEQKKKVIPAIASGDADGVWCTGYSEPDSGSDLASLQTSAVRDGDDYIINGQKVWTSCGHRARWCWLACRTNPNADKVHQGISIFLVDMKSPGVTVRPIPNMTGHHVFNELFFKDVRVPAANLVGEENKGWSVLMKALSFERNLGLRLGAGIRRLFDELVEYARTLELMDKESVRHRFAELATDLQSLRLCTYETAWKMDSGKNVIYEPSRDKVLAIRLMENIGRFGMELLGLNSQIAPTLAHRQGDGPRSRIENAIKFMYWNAPGMRSGGGTTETLLNIIAQFGLQLPKS